jgi:hypothetical protein
MAVGDGKIEWENRVEKSGGKIEQQDRVARSS